MEGVCAFCCLTDDRIITETELSLVIRDGYPVSKGHTLIIPKRHVGSFFSLTSDEQMDVLDLLNQSKSKLDSEFAPDGYNIGVNDGVAAGQTIPHLHVHLIPRYKGDQPDPRGGLRWVIPEKADYWSRP